MKKLVVLALICLMGGLMTDASAQTLRVVATGSTTVPYDIQFVLYKTNKMSSYPACVLVVDYSTNALSWHRQGNMVLLGSVTAEMRAEAMRLAPGYGKYNHFPIKTTSTEQIYSVLGFTRHITNYPMALYRPRVIVSTNMDLSMYPHR